MGKAARVRDIDDRAAAAINVRIDTVVIAVVPPPGIVIVIDGGAHALARTNAGIAAAAILRDVRVPGNAAVAAAVALSLVFRAVAAVEVEMAFAATLRAPPGVRLAPRKICDQLDRTLDRLRRKPPLKTKCANSSCKLV